MSALSRLVAFILARPLRLAGLAGLTTLLLVLRRRRAAGAAGSSPPAVLRELSYSAFLAHLERKAVKTAEVAPDALRFKLREAAAGASAAAGSAAAAGSNVTYFTRPVAASAHTVDLLHKAGVDFRAATSPSRLLPIVLALAPLAYLGIMLGVLWKMYGDATGSAGKRASGSQGQGGPDGRRLGFADMAGADEAKASVMEVVDFLRDPSRYEALGARVPRGVLLSGPPGTGKTLLARIIASEAGLPFIFCAGSDFVEVFAGRGAARVRDLFKRARKAAPCVLFFDELDALGKERCGGDGMGGSGGSEEREQTLNQLLAAMDGFDSQDHGIVVIAATNRYEVLDEALVRPGRFDRVIRVGLPSRRGRADILRVHLRNKRLRSATGGVTVPGGAGGGGAGGAGGGPAGNAGHSSSSSGDIGGGSSGPSPPLHHRRRRQAEAGDPVDPEALAAASAGFSGAALAHVVNEGAIAAVRAGRDCICQQDLLGAIRTYRRSRGLGSGGSGGSGASRGSPRFRFVPAARRYSDDYDDNEDGGGGGGGGGGSDGDINNNGGDDDDDNDDDDAEDLGRLGAANSSDEDGDEDGGRGVNSAQARAYQRTMQAMSDIIMMTVGGQGNGRGGGGGGGKR